MWTGTGWRPGASDPCLVGAAQDGQDANDAGDDLPDENTALLTRQYTGQGQRCFAGN